MNKRFFLVSVFVSMFFLMMTVPSYGQAEFSLDDLPLPFGSAEDEYGLGLPAMVNFFIGPSPSLAIWGFIDSDILFAGPVLAYPIPPTTFVDGLSSNHTPFVPPMIGLRFSIDRVTGGIPGAASNLEAGVNQQCADMYDSTMVYMHPMNFVPLPPPGGPPYYGGPLPPAGTGFSNILFSDDSFFGLLTGLIITPPWPAVAPLIQPGGMHDNIDAYNDFPSTTRYYTVAPAEAPLTGLLSADIMMLGGAVWAFAPQCGLDNFGPGSDSIDALVVWDNNAQGQCEPGIDYALFSLAPGSATLTQLVNMGFAVDGGTVFMTDFQGWFYTFTWSWDNGLAPTPVPPLLGNRQDVNIDALEVF